jgi:uncharacterized caspase-like protein
MRLAKLFSFLPGWSFLICALLVFAQPAAAQQPEKRIALVVGNGAYAKEPLATAANDAGLIAQTLQAAGFDVVGARDLDGDTLRRSFRDFIQKAESSGPGTVAMIYLAGYGVQLAGENFFIPVDSTINHDTDIPIEGLRISDYIRQLAALPLKLSVVVLDAARQQPFIQGGQPIASGLALVEPEPNMLVAFNAAPGTVAPSEPGPYGVYAQSLAEMIRTGGLSLTDVFDRLRLRVNESSKGALVPWDAHKIEVQFTFFERAPDAPPVQGAPDQVAAIRDKPIRELSVQDAYAAALERDTLQDYEDFIVTYPNDPLARRVRAIAAARREAITWRRTYRADTPQAYWSYLRRYPNGPHAGDARRRLAILTAPLEPPPSFAMMEYDIPPPPPDEIVYVDRPVLVFSDPDFGFVPPPPPPVYYLPPPPPEFVLLPPPIAPVGLFILPRPLFVAMPVYVRPPVYVAPPPNNIIFQNIHNTTVINNVINRPAAAAPAAAPGGTAPVISRAAAVGATPALPPAVAQRANLIQQGKAPVPPSASINPVARAGTPQLTPATAAPSAQPQQPLPRANALPVPGAKGAPSAPPPAPGASPTARATPPTAQGPTPNAPAGAAPAVAPPKPAAGQTPPSPTPAQPQTPPTAGRKNAAPSAPSAPGPTPGVTATRPVAPAAPQPPPQVARPTPAPTPPPTPHVAPQSPVAHAPAAPPPPHVAPQPPVAHAPPAPPPVTRQPPPAVARPAPPPPPPAARAAPPPAPAVARPAPPAPPPPVARAAPPPPPAVARPAAPPAAAAGKKCPPNVPRC